MEIRRHHRITLLLLGFIVLKINTNFSLTIKDTTLFEALSVIVQQTFLDERRQLLFYSNFDKNSTYGRHGANDIINGLLHNISYVTYMILCRQEKAFLNFEQNEVVLLENVSTFRRFYHQMKGIGNMDLARTLLFISSLRTLDDETIYLIFKDLYYMEMISVALVIRLADGDIVMLTYFPFTSASCRDFKPVIINRYLADQHRWQNNEYFPAKLNDFYGCPVYLCTWQDMPYFSAVVDTENGNVTDYVGLEAELLKYVASTLNFSIEIYWIDPIRENVDNRESYLSKIFSQHCDIALGAFAYRQDLDYTSTFSQTTRFMFSYIYIVTNVVDFYTIYEKLAFPFQYTVWFALGLTFALSSLLICICGRRRRQWAGGRNFLICSANKTPHFHLYALAVGGNMTTTHMPKRNFARFLLTCWIILTFVLRIAYQSGMYQMLRENKQWNPPQTIENVFQQNYLISIAPENLKYLAILPDTERVQIINTTAMETFRQMLNGKEPLAFIVPYEYFGYFAKNNGSQWQRLHMVKERLLTQQLVIYVRHHSYFVPVINEKLSIALNYGFITTWRRKNILSLATVLKHTVEAQRMHNKNMDKNPLSMNELGAIFMILIWLHVFAFTVFLIELMWHRYGNVVQTLVNL